VSGLPRWRNIDIVVTAHPSQAGVFFSFRAPPRSREYPKIVSLWDAASAPLIETRRSKQSCTGAGEPAPSEPLRKKAAPACPNALGPFYVGRRACHEFSSSRDHRNQTTTTAFRVGRRQTPPKAPAVRLLRLPGSNRSLLMRRCGRRCAQCVRPFRYC
jgi:hypothetical protein